MKSVNEELAKGEKEYLDRVMNSLGYGLWDVTDERVIYFERDPEQKSCAKVERLLAFPSWRDAYVYADEVANGGGGL